MSKLVHAINKVLAAEGNEGRTRLALAAKRTEQMIDRYSKQICRPSSNVAFKIALACGFERDEALEIAVEVSSVEAKAG